MPTPTYDLLVNNTFSSAAAFIDISSISGSYRDLVIVFDVIRSTTGNAGIIFNLNNNFSGPYAHTSMEGNGSSSSSSSTSSSGDGNFTLTYNTLNATARTQGMLHLLDYSDTSKEKTFLGRIGNPLLSTSMIAGHFGSTAAINRVRISSWDGSSFASGSNFQIYGIAA